MTLPAVSDIALKEWAVAVKTLGQGRADSGAQEGRDTPRGQGLPLRPPGVPAAPDLRASERGTDQVGVPSISAGDL